MPKDGVSVMNKTQRKSTATRGDDTTLTRFVKLRPGQPKKPGRPLRADHPSARDGRTRNRKSVYHPSEVGSIFSSGHNFANLGAAVRIKNRLQGYRIFALSLEERATCPRSCKHWLDCYGNGTPLAKRIEHGPALERAIVDEIRTLMAKPWPGVLIRLHELGDFYSVRYVRLWGKLLAQHPRLSIWGYTAHQATGHIGKAIGRVWQDLDGWERFAIRFSDKPLSAMSTRTVERQPDGSPPKIPGAIVCPEQIDTKHKQRCCATCALCWTVPTNIAFIRH